jgi:hypothetical protein
MDTGQEVHEDLGQRSRENTPDNSQSQQQDRELNSETGPEGGQQPYGTSAQEGRTAAAAQAEGYHVTADKEEQSYPRRPCLELIQQQRLQETGPSRRVRECRGQASQRGDDWLRVPKHPCKMGKYNQQRSQSAQLVCKGDAIGACLRPARRARAASDCG